MHSLYCAVVTMLPKQEIGIAFLELCTTCQHSQSTCVARRPVKVKQAIEHHQTTACVV